MPATQLAILISRIQIAFKRTQRAPLGLQRNGAHAASSKPISKLVQPRQRRANIPAVHTTITAPAINIDGSGPEHLGGRGGAGPYDRIEVLWSRLLGPQEMLSAENELGLCGAQVFYGVECVCLVTSIACTWCQGCGTSLFHKAMGYYAHFAMY